MKLLHIENKLAELFRMKSRRRTAAIKRPKTPETAKQEVKEAPNQHPHHKGG